jgi:hypothetical protein
MGPQQFSRPAAEARQITRIKSSPLAFSVQSTREVAMAPSDARKDAGKSQMHRVTTLRLARRERARTSAQPAKAQARSGRRLVPIAAAPARLSKASAAANQRLRLSYGLACRCSRCMSALFTLTMRGQSWLWSGRLNRGNHETSCYCALCNFRAVERRRG